MRILLSTTKLSPCHVLTLTCFVHGVQFYEIENFYSCFFQWSVYLALTCRCLTANQHYSKTDIQSFLNLGLTKRLLNPEFWKWSTSSKLISNLQRNWYCLINLWWYLSSPISLAAVRKKNSNLLIHFCLNKLYVKGLWIVFNPGKVIFRFVNSVKWKREIWVLINKSSNFEIYFLLV